jgi:hypothetical protein
MRRSAPIAVLASLACAAAAQEPARWPRAIALEQGTLVVYSPQLEQLEGVTLSGRAAVSWEAKGDAPVFGVFWFDARVLVDKERRLVHVEELAVTRVRFPSATPEQERRVEELIEAEVPRWDLTPALDELQAAIATAQRARTSAQKIAAAPPKLVFSTEPAVLLLFDGEPAVRPVADAGLERVVNTPLLVVRDPSARRFYLGSGTLWYEAPGPKGPWTPVPAPTSAVKAFFDANPPPPPAPGAADPAPATTQQAVPAAQQPAAPPPTAPETPPKIVVATEPTELIVFDGTPSWVPLGTDGALLYADNTDGDVLVHVPTSETFVLLSGRWYKAASLAGPWTPVRPDRLPAAFRAIPPDSPVGNVRTFVAGTEEAEDALADTQIPQTTAVKRDQTLAVTYDGEPRFKEIEGTSMAYAVNTPFSVIRDSGRYWCCHQGVWYVAPTPAGPWTVSDRRPPSVDQLPPTVPVYNVKYVHVYQATPSVVYVGYLPGYVGVYPYHGAVVYGTGYHYPPYVGAVHCYPYPATFGLHLSFNPWTGFGVGVSWGTPFFSVGIHFGGYARFYGPAGYRVPARPAYGYRAPPAGYRARSGAAAAGARPPATRPAAVGQTRASAGNLYERPGNVARNAPRTQAAARRPPASSGGPNDVYGDRDGNVYRQSPSGGWEKNTASGWQQAGGQPRSAAGAGGAPAGLSADAAARSRTSGGAWGAGGARGGGGRGGRR